MTATAEMLFNLQRFQILSHYASSPESLEASPAYAYAWERGVYPIGHDHASWHEPYSQQFQITEERMSQLGEFLDDLWTNDKTITFYELESHYGVRNSVHSGPSWDRPDLIGACRYLKLLDWFDAEFWTAMVGESNCPTEARSIMRPLGKSEVRVF